MVLASLTTALCTYNSTFISNTTQNITCNNTAHGNTAAAAGGIGIGIKAFLITLCAVVFVIGVPGNLIVAYVLGIKKRNSANNSNAFIVCLAVADLLASFCVPLVTIHDLLSSDYLWHLGTVLCYLLTPLLPVTLIASSWSLVLISIDRYRVISNPFSDELSTANKGIRITLVWALAIIMNIPFFVLLDTSIDKTCRTKHKMFSADLRIGLAVCTTVVGWIIPLTIMAVIYHKITRHLRDGENYHRDTQVIQKQIRSENKKIVKMFLVIVCIYITATLPFAVLSVVQICLNQLVPSTQTNVHLNTLYMVLPNVTVLNSCVNPVVYARMHKEINGYLTVIWNRLKRLFCCQQMNPTIQISNSIIISNHACPTIRETSFKS